MKKWLAKCLAFVLLLTLLAPQWLGEMKASAATPANPNATQAAKDVLNYFDTMYSNNQIISSQIVSTQYGYNEIDHLGYLTSKYPAMLAMDMGYTVSSTGIATWRDTMVEQAIDYWNKGGLVTMSWHETNPLDVAPDAGGWNSVISSMSQADFDSMTTPGKPLYNKWLAHIDLIASYLKAMRDQGVVVLWRPYHEMNIGFWWGGKTADSYKNLWQNMYDRYTNYHGLNNLIWVWSPARDDNNAVTSKYYPGSAYVDLGGADIYVQNRSDVKFTNSNNELTSVMAGKRYGLSEVGLLPYEGAVQASWDYTWFQIWSTGWMDNQFYGFPNGNGPGNDPYLLRQFYANPVTITRDEVPAFGRTIDPGTFIFKDAFNRYASDPATPVGGAPENWTIDTTGGTVAVAAVKSVGIDGQDRSVKIDKTLTSGGASAKKSFTPETGIVTFKASLRTEDASWKDFLVVDSSSPSKVAVHIGLNNGYLTAYNGTTHMSLQPITYGKFYDVKAVVNTTTQKYDLYVNGVKVANQFSFRDSTAANVAKIAFGVASGVTGTLYVDNVRIFK